MRHLLRALACLACLVTAVSAHAQSDPRDFVFIGGDRISQHPELLRRPGIEGMQVIYTWRSLEPEEGVYDFSAIEADLAELEANDMDLFAQIQDRFFLPEARHVPDYILNDPQYGGGLARQYDYAGDAAPIGQGWAAMQWNPAVRARFQALLRAIGERFDGRLYGVNLPETSFDPMEMEDTGDGFTCDGYFAGTLENMAALRAAFRTTLVVQYINFWPCEWNNDRGYMERAFGFAMEQRIGVGGPDIVPYRRGQMMNSYPFVNRHRDDLPIVTMAVQEPTLTYVNPDTGRPFSRDEFVAFARDYLGVDVIFWSAEAPWLQTP